ncbi:MAG: N-acetylmuramoyl-L-alanine amidase [Bacteroidetes bacterium]|nr:N-acetylmuramoyl-L-alanine amidase [Bacteroidota bacterium]
MKKILFILLTIIAPAIGFSQNKVKLIIDAGHGGNKDPKDAKSKYGDKESDFCLAFAQALYDYAKENNIDAVMTRTKKNQSLTFDQRSGYKSEPGVKTVYISFHFHAETAPNIRGAEVWYSSKTPNANTSKKLAEKLKASFERLNDYDVFIRDKEAVVFSKNDMPAVIIMGGYLTNDTELKHFKDEGYQKEMAVMIVKAVNEL